MVKIVEQSYDILTPVNGQEVLKHIEMCGRTCYQSFEKAGDGTAERFAKHIVSRHHESVIEHFSISVRFIIDRAIANELVRHRLASFSQESTRYCCYANDKFENEISVIVPSSFEPDTPLYNTWLKQMNDAEKSYLTLLEQGATPEMARSVLPCCLKTQIVMTANLREWRHVFQMRCSDAAHPDIRFLMRRLRDDFKRIIPVIFDDLGEENV